MLDRLGDPQASTVVVVGASGFIGRNLVRALRERNIELIGVSQTGLPIEGCRTTVCLARIDELPALPSDVVVVNVAAYRYDAENFASSQSAALSQNCAITGAVYQFCVRRGIKEVRLASSIAVYPADTGVADDNVPVDLNGWPHPRESGYGWSKRWAEICAELHQRQFGINTLAFRLTNPYGPYDAVDARRAHVVPALIIRALSDCPTLELKGDPQAERDFVFAEDVAQVFYQSLLRRGEHTTYNLACGVTTRIEDVAREILSAAHVSKPLVTHPIEDGGVAVRRASAQRLREAFSMAPLTCLETGLKRTVAWYRDALAG